MEPESVLLVMQIVALTCLSVLCVFLISLLSRLRTFLAGVEKDLKEISSKAIPVFENLEIITEKIKSVTENIDEQVVMVKHSITSMKEIADNILNFERRIQERIEEPVMDTVTMFVAAFKGVRAFVDRLRG